MERGFIQGKLEIKFLLLYILSRLEAPVDLDILTDVAMCDNGVTYFDFTAALAEIVETDHACVEDGRYSITDKGRKNGAVTEDELPYSVCLRCDQRLEDINQGLRREKRIHTSCESLENGKTQVTLGLDGEDGALFSVSLVCPPGADTQSLISRFRKDPEGYERALRAL